MEGNGVVTNQGFKRGRSCNFDRNVKGFSRNHNNCYCIKSICLQFFVNILERKLLSQLKILLLLSACLNSSLQA